MKKLSVLLSSFLIIVAGGFLLSPDTKVSAQQVQDKGWKVWVKTNPCSGRFDWVSVAKENPTYGGGGGIWSNADLIVTGTGMFCVSNSSQSCSFAAATAEAAIVRASDKFSDYCCKEYSVWENSQTRQRSVVVGKFGTAGYPWRTVAGPMCCAEAEALAGIPGACSSDGRGNNCFASDPGMASTNRQDHYNWAQGQDAARLEANLRNKINLLYNCPSMSRDQLTSAFADNSVLIARQVQNAACFGSDRGAINTDWSAHKEWAMTQSRSQLVNNLQWKMAAAFKCLDRTAQARLFADSSVVTAKAPQNDRVIDDINKPVTKGKGDKLTRSCDPAVFSLIPGTWQSEWGPVTLSGSCDRITGYWVQSSSQRGEITGGSFNSDSRTLTLSYRQSWNNVTDGRASLTLSADGKRLEGGYTGGGGNGVWKMHK